MQKIWLIIQREYLTRVKKKSFIVMTILGPVLLAALMIVPIWLSMNSNEMKTVAVIDQTGIFFEKFKDTDNIRFHYLVSDVNAAKDNFRKSGDYALLVIPKTEVALPTNAILYSEGQVNLNVKSYIDRVMTKQLEDMKLQARLNDLRQGSDTPVNVDDILRSIKTTVDVSTMKIDEKGNEEKSYTEVSMVAGIFAGILIYMFIFMFGSQVMRGVIEEKTSRIVEVIISSVKPFQLMMGKVIGVALVGLTQFLLWVVLTFVIITAVVTPMTAAKNIKAPATEQVSGQPNALDPAAATALIQKQAPQDGVNEVFDAISSINFPVMLGSFLFFFLFGYLLYAAFFAAIGGAVDSEADTQQFMMPITVPLLLSMVLSQFILQDPTGPVAFWLSIIPFTSPVVMMMRIPFGVPYWELALSMVLLILGFIGATWMAAKIYRTGILMYGKKVGYRELWKWLKY
ncbi:MAG TPA: ABC transporter permease [Bacteroidales bacterium]|nr:ABC transporter permease [Bacteroidales bacterium]HPS73208.1 ABC transporter permease [Bacteroidales bacterium]